MNANLTCHTSCERCSASPAHTPPTTRPSTGRRSRGGSGTSAAREGGVYGVCTPPSSPTNLSRPSTARTPQGSLRVGSGSTLMAGDPAGAPRSWHDITDLRGPALRARRVLLRRPRYRHPPAHRHQVGRWRLLRHRG